MLNYLKELFNSDNKVDQNNNESSERKLQIAACALLIEIATADDKFTQIEKDKIVEIMKKRFSLSESEIHKIISRSEEEIEKSISIYEFTDILNQQLNNAEKYSIIKNLWRIAYADGDLDAYEDHYINTISNNLHLYNQDRIAAKLEIKNELGL